MILNNEESIIQLMERSDTVSTLVLYTKHDAALRARSDEQCFFGIYQLSQKLWQNICVHTQQRKTSKKLCHRIFVNVSLFVLQALQKTEGVCRIQNL